MDENMDTIKSPGKKITPALRGLGKIIFYGFLLAVVINLPFVGMDLYHNISKAKTFDRIGISMPEPEVREMLHKQDIRCGISAFRSDDCYFSDFWRHYQIH